MLADQFVDGHVPNDGVAALINGWQPKEAHFVARVVEDWEPEGGADEEAKQLRVTVGQYVYVPFHTWVAAFQNFNMAL